LSKMPFIQGLTDADMWDEKRGRKRSAGSQNKNIARFEDESVLEGTRKSGGPWTLFHWQQTTGLTLTATGSIMETSCSLGPPIR